MNALYVNPEGGQYWVIDYHLFNPDGDDKTKLNHVREMLTLLVTSKCLAFDRVVMDGWHAMKDLMLFIESLGKIKYCPFRDNRQVDDSGGERG